MKKALIISLVVAVLVIVLIIISSFKHKLAPANQISNSVFPSGSTTPGGSANGGFMTVQTQDGQSITVQNFLTNGTTIPDPSNAGNYYLTGFGPGDFAIGYNSATQVFTVSLDQEPIGKKRLDAESFISTTLGVTKQQLCSLKYFVTTTSDVNAMYAGRNLGFSFCPGAVQLPD